MSEILQEKNLREIYKKSKTIPISNFNTYFPITLGAILFFILQISDVSIEVSYDKINELSSFLFSSIFSTLGFLVAGYTIFCTITPLDLQKKMIQHKDQKNKSNFFQKSTFYIYSSIYLLSNI
ncbi:hypothetical protein [Acinetobacter ursingii]|uniref:hypothetical protein n=1 Tax=Acinetobacter ursingii TaxID=108980 RepID=UPI0021CD53A6|nr:hypothetical protein [Acinetobacter ursingii]MCU4481807.1 hypothetical protein [Acinetobacter ursingii]MCU4506296.1 hypothetical protein [Acinetobacter ursingii]MCU4571547.1 hypothetical protein [Acinetobacter ursingii]